MLAMGYINSRFPNSYSHAKANLIQCFEKRFPIPPTISIFNPSFGLLMDFSFQKNCYVLLETEKFFKVHFYLTFIGDRGIEEKRPLSLF